MTGVLCASLALLGLVAVAAQAGEVRSEDAVVRWRGDSIEAETGTVRWHWDTRGGTLRRTAWVDRGTGTDLLRGQPTEDFSLVVNGQPVSSAEPGWEVAEPRCEVLKHGEVSLELSMGRDGLLVRRRYVLHPGLSLVRGWLEIENHGDAAVQLSDPPIATCSYGGGAPELLWMSGAELTGDSWRMRTEALPAEPRSFDSYDPPPSAQSAAPLGDGIDARVLLNDRSVWPETGWAHSAHAADVQTYAATLQVAAGDRLSFVVSRHGNMGWDTTQWDPVVTYADGAAFQASAGFSNQQGQGGWRYEYLGDDGQRQDMVYDAAPGQYGERWRLRIGTIEPFISATDLHPDPAGCAARVFVAPHAGQVTVTGTVRNTGNGAPPGPGFRMGTMTYAPWFCLRDPATGVAAYMGFDCMAHWRAEFTACRAGSPSPAPPAGRGTETAPHNAGRTADVRVAGYSRHLEPGETVRTPYAFCGVFSEDLDNMGQELLEWQYRYQWDYTREPWFPAVRMLGYWYKGTNWGSHGWVGGDPDWESTFRKVFRTADFMRQVGGDTYHRDWGWWDRAGDWNGPDFRATGEYLRHYGMGQLIYAFLYTVDSDSSVAREHPGWLANPNTLDQSLPAVVDYEVGMLDRFYQQWGPYQWRNDSTPTAPRDGDDTVLLAQQQGFMAVIRRFLDDHADCAFQGVNGGGMALNWEYLALASGFQFTDGQAQQVADYYASYLFPPDKINDMPDIWDPAKYDPATWRALLCSNIDMTGDTFDPVKLEGLRDLLDVYHYLQGRGVVGRWVRVYHPQIAGDDEWMYLQRLSWDRQRGIIITKHRIEGTVTVWPKGLLPEATYEVGFHEAPETFNRTGAELMADGLTLSSPAPGELIYLNLPDHPGNAVDRTAPTAPANVRCAVARYMGVPGVEVTWDAGADDHWLSHYEVRRDGELVDRVAKGCFCFDHSAGADPAAQYEVCAVDGAGNQSAGAVTAPSDRRRRLVLDDSNAERVQFAGAWERETNFGPAYGGTLSNSQEAGAAFTVRFEGRSVTWHSRLGAEGGLARVTVDGEEPVTVSCYDADEIPGWPLFERAWEQSGPHTLRVEVAGQPDRRGQGTRVWLDGIAVEP